MWMFCLQSFLREYGWQFFARVALPHPLRTARAVARSASLDLSPTAESVTVGPPDAAFGGTGSIVGAGFCLKPIDPSCPSGRPNHDCQFLESHGDVPAPDMPAACRQCAIREIGLMALDAGAALYIMTSARDILLDVFAPALEERRFSNGLFTLCRYSLQPFAVGLFASGINGRLFTFQTGDCRDYRTWLKADVGIKDDQTQIRNSGRRALDAVLRRATAGRTRAVRFEKRGNVLYAVPASWAHDTPGERLA